MRYIPLQQIIIRLAVLFLIASASSSNAGDSSASIAALRQAIVDLQASIKSEAAHDNAAILQRIAILENTMAIIVKESGRADEKAQIEELKLSLALLQKIVLADYKNVKTEPVAPQPKVQCEFLQENWNTMPRTYQPPPAPEPKEYSKKSIFGPEDQLRVAIETACQMCGPKVFHQPKDIIPYGWVPFPGRPFHNITQCTLVICYNVETGQRVGNNVELQRLAPKCRVQP